MTDSIFSCEAPSAAGVMKEIQTEVQRKLDAGEYRDARIARAERHNMAQLKSQDEFLAFYLSCLREASVVDISDYEIHERRRALSPLLIRFKRLIWQVMKFYTYRLWSQQNQVNGLLVTAMEGMQEQYESRIQTLEDRIARLEQEAASSDS